MNIDSNTLNKSEPVKCKSCKVFYASEAFKGQCSECYKKLKTNSNEVKLQNSRKDSIQTQAEDNSSNKKIESSLPQIKEQPKVQQKPQQQKPVQQVPVQVDRKRCFDCKKKVGLLGIECKCGYVYCNSHRLPENHNCIFNHHELCKQRLKSTLVKVYNGKIGQI